MPDVIIEETQGSGGLPANGTPTAATWNQRLLNTLVRNNASLASLSSSQFTLPAGTYHMTWSAPCYRCDRHKTRVQNITDSTTVAVGTAEYSPSTLADIAQTRSVGSCVVTIAASKTFQLQHWVGTNAGGLGGLGAATSNGSNEIYSRIEITKQ